MYLCDVLKGRRGPGVKLLRVLGMRRVVESSTYYVRDGGKESK